jgi:hypothetical protein
MTIQTIARKQLDQPSPLYFARKGTADCYWFHLGCLRAFSDINIKEGRSVSLSVEDLAASDWRVITPRKAVR